MAVTLTEKAAEHVQKFLTKARQGHWDSRRREDQRDAPAWLTLLNLLMQQSLKTMFSSLTESRSLSIQRALYTLTVQTSIS